MALIFSEIFMYSDIHVFSSDSDIAVEGRVGSKGELFVPKEIHEKLGLRPGMRIVYSIRDGRLIVEPIPSIEDVLKEPTYVRIEAEDFHKFRKEISRSVEL